MCFLKVLCTSTAHTHTHTHTEARDSLVGLHSSRLVGGQNPLVSLPQGLRCSIQVSARQRHLVDLGLHCRHSLKQIQHPETGTPHPETRHLPSPLLHKVHTAVKGPYIEMESMNCCRVCTMLHRSSPCYTGLTPCCTGLTPFSTDSTPSTRAQVFALCWNSVCILWHKVCTYLLTSQPKKLLTHSPGFRGERSGAKCVRNADLRTGLFAGMRTYGFYGLEDMWLRDLFSALGDALGRFTRRLPEFLRELLPLPTQLTLLRLVDRLK